MELFKKPYILPLPVKTYSYYGLSLSITHKNLEKFITAQ